ncbi:hypothetical protein QJS10_CPA07g01030 [Acorus calamus]|uniref:WIYLD domain-containing protein n=1 Tax=Acorus calamus TaxID=4465 RepID=A0AAV9EEX0_ACOCL|nr:hypothetical protein QJS10_CPA07g01030 [Acorus calamus]
MAPRGRPKKVGLKRIDAAIDALLPLGFSRDVITRTINSLLKVYEGDHGWVFIEEASYKLLIDTILEEQEEESAKIACNEKYESDDDRLPISSLIGVGGTSTTKLAVPVVHEDVGWKDISCDNYMGLMSDPTNIRSPIHTNQVAEENSRVPRPAIRGAENEVDMVINWLNWDTRPTLRAPTYGWLSESDEEDAPESVPSPRNADMENRVPTRPRTGKRKSRWDAFLVLAHFDGSGSRTDFDQFYA